MTKDNHQRKSIYGNEDNPPGLAHVNALSISDNVDVGGVNRKRKSSSSENGVGGGSSGTAFHWLQQSVLASFVPGLLDARQPSPQPPGEAPLVCRTSSSQVPINGSETIPELLQSSGLVRGRVRRMPLVRPPVCVNHLTESDVLSEVLKSSESLHSGPEKFAYALVNGRVCRNLTGGAGGMFIAQKGGYK